jgi:hypothetical protein
MMRGWEAGIRPQSQHAKANASSCDVKKSASHHKRGRMPRDQKGIPAAYGMRDVNSRGV